MNRKIEVTGIIVGREESKELMYLVLDKFPYQFPSRIVQEGETLKSSIDICFSEFGLDTSDLPKKPIKVIDMLGRNLVYILLMECELSDLKIYLEKNTGLTLLGKDSMTGEARTLVEELEKKIEGNI